MFRYEEKWGTQTRSLGIMTELQGFRTFVPSLGIGWTQLEAGEWGATARGVVVGGEYAPLENFGAVKAGVWGNRNFFVFGFSLGMNALYYRNQEIGDFVLRPEIGYSIFYFFMKYGYNFLRNDAKNYLSPHAWTLGFYIPLIPKRGKYHNPPGYPLPE